MEIDGKIPTASLNRFAGLIKVQCGKTEQNEVQLPLEMFQ